MQIHSYWTSQVWPKYKAVWEMEEHTGGGDGDDNDDDTPSEKYGGFSKRVLEKFKNSAIYKMIDKVFVSLLVKDSANSRIQCL